jgi:protein SCO1/2
VRRGRRSFLASLAAFVALVPRRARADVTSHSTRGVVKSVGEGRARVRIAHEDIPGYMKAMTMPFDVRPELLAGVAVGDRVAFTFEQRESGDLVIVQLAKL